MRTYIIGLIVLSVFVAGLICGGTIAEKAARQSQESGIMSPENGGDDDQMSDRRIDYRDCPGGVSVMDTDHVTNRTSE